MTAKIEEDQGSIVQIVVITFSPEVVSTHMKSLLNVTRPLIGWIYYQDIIAKGYLVDKDFPKWIDNEARTILKSRCRLFYAHYKKIKTGSAFQPTQPLKLYNKIPAT